MNENTLKDLLQNLTCVSLDDAHWVKEHLKVVNRPLSTFNTNSEKKTLGVGWHDVDGQYIGLKIDLTNRVGSLRVFCEHTLESHTLDGIDLNTEEGWEKILAPVIRMVEHSIKLKKIREKEMEKGL